MKLHRLPSGIWDHRQPPASAAPLALGCKRLRPLAPRVIGDMAFPLKVETQQGGTRWNPTQEQVAMLEMLYEGGMRTPNAQQIEQIVAQLEKYGKIEGKNVFYWFQNHKARERQKQKRGAGGLTTYYVQFPQIKPSIPDMSSGKVDDALRKRKCMSRENRSSSSSSCASPVFQIPETLELFPLRPEQ